MDSGMREKLLEALFIELEHLGPNYRKKVSKPILAMDSSRFSSLQWMTMMYLFRNGPSSMSTIAASHGISKQQMTPIVEGLEKQGLVQRRVNPKNRREVLVSATQKGESLFRSLKKEAIGMWMGKLDSFSDEEITELIGHVHAIVQFVAKIDNQK
jgi:DNA-binding MarR family transcriptional regulator